MPLKLTLCALAVLVLTACSQDELLDKMASDEDKKFATQCLGRLLDGDVASLETKIDPTLKAPNLHDVLVRMAEMLPDGKPDSVKLVGVHKNTVSGVRTANLTYQYGYGDQYFLVNCASQTKDDRVTIVGISATPLEKQLEDHSKFELEGKPAASYAILIAATLAPVISVIALILCILESGLRRKWAWVLFIIFGIGGITLNWSTSEITYSIAHLQLFSAGAAAAPYTPWMIVVALPVGAVVYMARRFLNHRPSDRSNPY
jgi:hypothetical protein